MKLFVRQMVPAILALVVMTLLCGVIYPLAVTGVAQVSFHHKANGSIVKLDGREVGSSLIGQSFTSPQYFHPRPSAAGTGYDSMASSGSNLGPTNQTFIDTVAQRVSDYRTENLLSADVQVPVDAVTASGSGLDPQISIANAQLQANRVAHERGVEVAQVLTQIKRNTQDRPLGVLGDPGVNVLKLNIALDKAYPVQR